MSKKSPYFNVRILFFTPTAAWRSAAHDARNSISKIPGFLLTKKKPRIGHNNHWTSTFGRIRIFVNHKDFVTHFSSFGLLGTAKVSQQEGMFDLSALALMCRIKD
jgi:hypothetical protein